MMEEVSKKRYFRHNERVLHDLKAGDLVEIEKFPYSHWGIYVGDGKIVHLGADDLDLRVHLVILFKIFGMLFNKAKVRKEDFWIVVERHRANIRNHDDELGIRGLYHRTEVANVWKSGHKMFINLTKWAEIEKMYGVFIWFKTPLSVDEILKRANESIGYTGYNVFYSNCEHFATWCRYGNQNSKQVKQVMAVLFLVSLVCLLAVMEMDYSNYTIKLILIIYKERYIFAFISLCIVLYSPVYYFQNKFRTIDYRKHSNYEQATDENGIVPEDNQSDIKPELPSTKEGDIKASVVDNIDIPLEKDNRITLSLLLYLLLRSQYARRGRHFQEALLNEQLLDDAHELKMKKKYAQFDGALMFLSGDFRQTLPIIPRSTPADELNACLKSSDFWRNVKKLTFKSSNMRVQLQNDVSVERFSKQLMDICNGKMEIDRYTQCIILEANFCKMISTKDELIQNVFPNITRKYKNHQWLIIRAILAVINCDVNAINFNIQVGIPCEKTTFKSIDTAKNQDEVVNYPK